MAFKCFPHHFTFTLTLGLPVMLSKSTLNTYHHFKGSHIYCSLTFDALLEVR